MYSNAFSPWYSQPSIVEKAKRAMLIHTSHPPVSPRTVLNAFMVSAEPTVSSLYL